MAKLKEAKLNLGPSQNYWLLSVISIPANWRSLKVIAIGAVGLEFNSRAGQIRHSIDNGSPPLRRFFGAVLRCLGAKDGSTVLEFGTVRSIFRHIVRYVYSYG